MGKFVGVADHVDAHNDTVGDVEDERGVHAAVSTLCDQAGAAVEPPNRQVQPRLLVRIPLTFSFYRIKQEAEITRTLEGFKIEDVTLRDVRVRSGKVPVISMKIIAPQSIPDEKLRRIKSLIQEKINQEIIIEVITAIEF